MKKAAFKFDSTDLDGMREIMAKFSGIYSGTNENGENVIFVVSPCHIKTETAQKNGWTRINTYWHDGGQDEDYKK